LLKGKVNLFLPYFNQHLLSFVVLLVMFEFINRLLHLFLEKISHYAPTLMLGVLVAIAALLAPMHHRLEKMGYNQIGGEK